MDVYGFARETDEDRQKVALAYEALTARLEAAAERHGGRVFSGAAEGFFLEFPTAEAAVVAADEIASGPYPPVRVGVHIGQVSALPSGELEGEAVLVAARIQQAADRGAVLVSEAVRQALQGSAYARRLNKDNRTVRFDRPEAATAVYGFTHVQVVDEAALRAQRRRRMLTIGGGAIAAAAFIGVVFGRDIYTTLFPKHDHVAVLRLHVQGGDKEVADFADGLTDEIGYVLKQSQIPSVLGRVAETLRGSDRDAQARRYQVGAILDGTVSGNPNNLDIRLQIDDPVHHRQIWSHDFKGSGDDLQTQVSSRVISILTCSARALQPGSTVDSADIQAMYLKFCDLDADAASDAAALAEEERILREITTKAPNFSYGHSSLAHFLYGKSQVDPNNAQALLAEAGREADRAITLDPKNSDGYAARARLVAAPGYAEQDKSLLQAVSLPGATRLTHAIYAIMLGQVGRLNDAAVYAQKLASEDSSGDPDYVILIATSLAAQGKDDDADRALTRALEIAPNNPVIQGFRFHMYEWIGRWAEAESILNDEANRPPLLTQEEDAAAHRAFIEAMVSQEPAAKSAAREAEFASVAHDRSHLMVALSHLSALGLVEDAYRLADQFPPSPQYDDPTVLFTPLAGPMRRDPRFMTLAARLGLTAYWSSSGKWPDFCAAGDLPYNCRAEAAKMQGQQTHA